MSLKTGDKVRIKYSGKEIHTITDSEFLFVAGEWQEVFYLDGEKVRWGKGNLEAAE